MESEQEDISNYLLSLEDKFYREGYDSGVPHGELHGLFEGRALGREKAWDLWEEVGYYEGTAKLWKAVLALKGAQESRAYSTLEQLLATIEAFPTSNNSSSTESTSNPVDMTAQIKTIRSKYRTACASLGIRARLVAASQNGDGEKTNMTM